MGGCIAIGKALEAGGKGGPIQSIDSLKSLIPLGLYCLINQSYPTNLQICGVVLCISGAFIVGLFQ